MAQMLIKTNSVHYIANNRRKLFKQKYIFHMTELQRQQTEAVLQ